MGTEKEPIDLKERRRLAYVARLTAQGRLCLALGVAAAVENVREAHFAEAEAIAEQLAVLEATDQRRVEEGPYERPPPPPRAGLHQWGGVVPLGPEEMGRMRPAKRSKMLSMGCLRCPCGAVRSVLTNEYRLPGWKHWGAIAGTCSLTAPKVPGE